MTDERAMEVFDSGVGGLTVVRAILDLLPDEPLVYLGDTARSPYGPRPVEESPCSRSRSPRSWCAAT